MRAGLAMIQQTLTPEAAEVIGRSVEEAARRRHGQTTPLHVAATLHSSPSAPLRRACAASHPFSSHPLPCRALDLCFSVALDRLPCSAAPSACENSGDDPPLAMSEPPLSNALIAALKRAQAHQRRGSPETQHQPLLAVKVELAHLLLSILDDPGVSRVMREAGFSSPAVKATVELSLDHSPNPPSQSAAPCNLYLSPRLQQQHSTATGADPHRREEAKKVLEILGRGKKRNPVLVGDSDPEAVMKEALLLIERRELGGDTPSPLRLAQVVALEREFAALDRALIPGKIRELGNLIEGLLRASASNGGGGVILGLGDLKWLVENPDGFGRAMGLDPVRQQQQMIVSEIGRAAVAEMGRLLARFRDEGSGGGSRRVWVVGTATCATYLRCQVYHPAMEAEWDLQAVPIAPRSPLPGMFPRLAGSGVLNRSIESLGPKSKCYPALSTAIIPQSRPSEGTMSSSRTSLCTRCMESYEHELAKLVAAEFEKASSKTTPESQQALPHWLKIGTPSSNKPTLDPLQSKEQELMWKQKTEELQNRWRETCSRLHLISCPAAPAIERPRFPTINPRLSSSNLDLVASQPSLRRFTLSQSRAQVHIGSNNGLLMPPSSLERPVARPGSPVKTDLVLGQSKAPNPSLEKTGREFFGDILWRAQQEARFTDQSMDAAAGIADTDSLKKLCKGIVEKVGWQPEAASAVAAAVMRSKSGTGRCRGHGAKADTWLLFVGPDKVGKRKMAYALSELVFGSGPITIRLGSPRNDGGGFDDDGESDVNLRGKTSLDRVAETVRQNPFSVIVLEDTGHADAVVQGTIKRAMEVGRLTDSHGREVSLGSAIFILISDWLPEDLRSSQEPLLRSEEKILSAVNTGWQLELSIGEKTAKRRAGWPLEDDAAMKPRKQCHGIGLSLDLNLAIAGDDENSSDLTVEHEHEQEHEHGRLAARCSTLSNTFELIDLVDDAVLFKPVEFGLLRRRISESISAKFATAMGGGRSVQLDDGALDRMVGGVWLGGGGAAAFDEWVERVLVPSIHQLQANSKIQDESVVRLSSVQIGGRRQRSGGARDWLPSSVTIAVDGL